MRKRDGDRWVLTENIEEMNILAGCNAEGTATVGEFHARDRFTKIERGHLAQCSEIPPSNFAIFSSADTHSSVLAFVPNKTLNNAFARQAVGIGAKDKRFRVRSAKVKKTDFLLVSTSKEVLRGLLRVQSDRADNVVVRKSMKSFASVGIPNLRSEIGTTGNGSRSIK